MELPSHVQFLIARLTGAGFTAYAVGGCVRDTLLGRVPGDWDICTSALPEQVEQCFPDLRVAKTGLKHGTVTVLLEGQPFEITTFRRDGDYLDHRRPEGVQFVSSLEEDLARRDFTINAMAAGLDGEIHDPFGGRSDLAARCIRCVGDPDKRFEEDALRILRGLRLASQLEFEIDAATAESMLRNRELLQYVSGERIYTEMTKLLCSPGAAKVLEQYGAVFGTVFPELAPTLGFLQKNPHHSRDVWGHTVETIGYSQPDPVVRWALLLHDIGKPACFTVDEQGVGHFYGHPKESERLARQILTRLHVDNATRDAIATLVLRHDEGGPVARKLVRRRIGQLGPDLLLKLMEVKRADALGHVQTPRARARVQAVQEFTELIHTVLAEENCFAVKDLNIGGNDVLAAGINPGPEVGRLLHALLEDVLDGRCENTPEALDTRLREIIDTGKGALC